MAKDDSSHDIAKPDHAYISWRVQRPGYWSSKKIISDLAVFQDLLRHRERWDERDARPLAELLPDEVSIPEDAWKQHQLVEKRISRLIPSITDYLYFAGISTRYIFTSSEYDDLQQKRLERKHSYDIITDYFDLPDKQRQDAYRAALRCVEEGIGAYTARLKIAKRALFNPVDWVAALVRMPLTIAERANLIRTQSHHDAWVKIYLWLGAALMLSLISKVLGISIPWDKIPQLFK